MRPGPGQGATVAISWPEDPVTGARTLRELGVVDDDDAFGWLLGVTNIFVKPVPGPHLLETGLTPAEILRRLGRLSSRAKVKVTLPEGYDQFQVADRLERQAVCGRDAFLRAAADREDLLALGVPGLSAEGYLFPATYDLWADTDPERVVATLVKEAKRRARDLLSKHAAGFDRLKRRFDFAEDEVITLASVVEKEAMRADEMPVIASVFLNRLSDPAFRPARMLQSDPTAGYGCRVEPDLASCADFDGKRILPVMLRDRDNPYNTYRREGLPPGPIANPGVAAIEAVLDPADTRYLFFVARGDGRHTFSRSFEEHDAAVKARREGRRAAD
jgi:UPF0755 protein